MVSAKGHRFVVEDFHLGRLSTTTDARKRQMTLIIRGIQHAFRTRRPSVHILSLNQVGTSTFYEVTVVSKRQRAGKTWILVRFFSQPPMSSDVVRRVRALIDLTPPEVFDDRRGPGGDVSP